MQDNELIHYFAYQPPVTPERRRAEAAIASAALQFAETIIKHCQHPECRDKALWAAQQAAMLASKGAALDEIGLRRERSVERLSDPNVQMLQDMRRSRTVPPLEPPQ